MRKHRDQIVVWADNEECDVWARRSDGPWVLTSGAPTWHSFDYCAVPPWARAWFEAWKERRLYRSDRTKCVFVDCTPVFDSPNGWIVSEPCGMSGAIEETYGDALAAECIVRETLLTAEVDVADLVKFYNVADDSSVRRLVELFLGENHVDSK